MIFLYLPVVTCHLIFSNPSVWDNYEPLHELERPMTPNTNPEDWYCKGKPKKNDYILELVPGFVLNIPVICGEAPIGSKKEQATQFCDNDRNALHGGGGCSLSIADGDSNDFTMITISHDCPKLDWSGVDFVIPQGLPEIVNGKCSWTWVPPTKNANQESYNNCFSCSVSSKIKGKLTGGTKLYPNPVGTYKDRFLDGALIDWNIQLFGNNEQFETTVDVSTTKDTTKDTTTDTTTTTTDTTTTINQQRCRIKEK
jgi:hypothetical protein